MLWEVECMQYLKKNNFTLSICCKQYTRLVLVEKLNKLNLKQNYTKNHNNNNEWREGGVHAKVIQLQLLQALPICWKCKTCCASKVKLLPNFLSFFLCAPSRWWSVQMWVKIPLCKFLCKSLISGITDWSAITTWEIRVYNMYKLFVYVNEVEK